MAVLGTTGSDFNVNLIKEDVLEKVNLSEITASDGMSKKDRDLVVAMNSNLDIPDFDIDDDEPDEEAEYERWERERE